MMTDLRRTRLGTVFLAVLAMTFVAACGDDEPAGPGGAGVTLIPAPNSGADQIGAPGQTFSEPISVQVLVGGVPAGGVTVQWTPTDGTVSSATSVSGTNGIASVIWTLGGSSSAKSGDGFVSSAEIAKVVSMFAAVPSVDPQPSTKINAFSVPASYAVIEVRNNLFAPYRPGGNTTVAPGTSVTWVWVSDATDHNVSPTGGSALPIRSGEPRDGPFVYTQLFEAVGEYTYECTVHGGQGMTGTVSVSLAP